MMFTDDVDSSYQGDMTALMAAVARAIGADDPYSKQLVEAARAPDPSEYPAALVKRVTEGVSLRTLFLDDAVQRACVSGIQQVVILGSGLDTRAWRLPWRPGTRIWHLDGTGTVNFARGVLGEPRGVSLIEIACDVATDDWAQQLLDDRFTRSEPTVFIAEALLLYLSPDAAEHVVRTAADLASPGSRLAFTYLGANQHGEGIQELAGATSAMGGVFRSAITSPEAFLSSTSWSVVVSDTYGQYASTIGKEWTHDEAGGVSWLSVAER